MLNLTYHGGGCCGINHIRNLSAPSFILNEEEFKTGATPSAGWTTRGAPVAFHTTRPKETCLERFDAFIELVKQARTSGAIEVVLADATYDPASEQEETRYELWHDLLEERGFVEVLSFWNSNSDNRCRVYYLVTGQELYEEASSDVETFELEDDEDF